ncbi:MAG: N-6 DNA methylase [Desulfomonilaceae bacterium]|nr:N-6 DNA methylase [Desulfomonilaceae bacterium]
MNKDIVTANGLQSHLWEAANILRGPVDAADFKTYVFPLLFFKRLSDVHDEQYQAALAESGEFYTPRSVVRLMVNILDPQEGESIYDPACGTGGMLLEAIHHVKGNHGDDRTLWGKLFGQEKNLTTSAIARMNCFLHGIEDFRIERGDPLSEPKLVQGDLLMRFDVVLANPPYSIKQWDREAFSSDPWGRNIFGTPPQGRADYAFWQHIIQSIAPKTGRCAILFPHGVLFRQEEAEMRRKVIEADVIECVLGLAPTSFTTHRWKRVSSFAALPSPRPAVAKSSLSTPSTRSLANEPKAFSPMTILLISSMPMSSSKTNPALPGSPGWKKSDPKTAI